MLIADIKGKLTLNELTSEDFLTSSVFSVFKYLEPRWLEKFINLSININRDSLDSKITDPVLDFWPWFSAIPPSIRGVEPDLIICSGEIAIIIEAKNYSGKSGIGIDLKKDQESENIEKDIIDQLGREYIVGRNKLINSVYQQGDKTIKIEDFVLIFLTRHSFFPEGEIRESIEAIEEMLPGEYDNSCEKIYWVNWQMIIPILNEIINESKDSYESKIAMDLIEFLERRELSIYNGFKFMETINYLGADLDSENLFYNKVYKEYWGFLREINLNLFSSCDYTFYKKSITPYWEYLKMDINFTEDSKIFYGRKI